VTDDVGLTQSVLAVRVLCIPNAAHGLIRRTAAPFAVDKTYRHRWKRIAVVDYIGDRSDDMRDRHGAPRTIIRDNILPELS